MNLKAGWLICLFWVSVGHGQSVGTNTVQASSKTVTLSMSRATFDEVIELGPQRFIATLRLDPHMEKGRFLGWRIIGFAATSRLANSQNIFAGDTIISVNDEPLERPEQFMRAWEVVRNAAEVKVTLIRKNVKWIYRWKIRP